MKPVLIAGMAVVGIAVLVFYARGSRDSPRPPQQTLASPRRDVAPPRTADATKVTPKVAAPSQDDEDRPEVEIDREPPPASLHPKVDEITDNAVARIEAVRTNIRVVIRPCVANVDASRRARLQVRYTVRILAGRARVAAVKLMTSTLGDSAVDDCVVDAIAKAEWAMPGADGAIPIVDKIELGEL